MRNKKSQASPGKGREPQQSFGRRAAAPGQEERGIPLPFSNGNPSVGQKKPPSGLQPADFENGRTCGAVTYEYGDPSGYFTRISLILVGAVDADGRRAQLVQDVLWGRWSRPPDVDVEGPRHGPGSLTREGTAPKAPAPSPKIQIRGDSMTLEEKNNDPPVGHLYQRGRTRMLRRPVAGSSPGICWVSPQNPPMSSRGPKPERSGTTCSGAPRPGSSSTSATRST